LGGAFCLQQGDGDEAGKTIRYLAVGRCIEQLRAALESLLGIKQQYYGQSGLYNALYQSHLTIQVLRLENGKASIYLAGRLLLGGVCDNPRLEAQLVETAMQFSTVQQVEIFFNGKPLKDWLSEK
jgi:hypothetical protein